MLHMLLALALGATAIYLVRPSAVRKDWEALEDDYRRRKAAKEG